MIRKKNDKGFALMRTLANAKNLDKIQPYSGFTLIELLVAMTIMAVLMAVGLVSYQGSRKAARDAKRKADLEQIRSALEIYRSDCGTYPETLGTSLSGFNDPGEACSTDDVYLTEVPTDPLSPTKRYGYSRETTNTYTLCASLENPVAGTDITDCDSCVEVCNYKVVNP